jgi:hypothetical protein
MKETNEFASKALQGPMAHQLAPFSPSFMKILV